jgi:ankyrin repeat protein
MNNLQSNYIDARITLVHDCYIRKWKWVDAESACFAIVMSTWFSRGWTSLELSKSGRVKVLFKSGDQGGLVIKDLDEDILAKPGEPSTPWRQVATASIFNLRGKRITNVNDILTALGPRYTSWPKDMSIISGLLAGIEVPVNRLLQEINQRILRKMGKISHEHLFHNSATMTKGFSWCPANLLDIPLALTLPTLKILGNGDLDGQWMVFKLDAYEIDVWKDTHPLIRVKVQLALKHKDEHQLLVEPEARFITRALLVKVMRNEDKTLHCQFVGPVHFLQPYDRNEKGEKKRVRIGDAVGMDVIEDEKVFNIVSKIGTRGDATKRKGRDATSFGNAEDGEWWARLRKAADLNIQSPTNLAELLSKEGDGHKEVIELLKENVADPNFWEVVRLLLQKVANKDPLDKHKKTALHIAAEKGYVSVVRLLLEKKADANVKDSIGRTPLQLAAVNGDEEAVKLLLQKNADPNVQDDYKRTALHCAVWVGSEVIVESLLEKRAHRTVKDIRGHSALHLGAERGQEEVFRRLFDGVADMDDTCNDGQTVLHHAAWGGSRAIVMLLLKNSDPNVPDKENKTALHLAAQNGNKAVVKLLLEKGVELESKDSSGRTSLLLAAERGHKAVVKLLLENGAELEPEDSSGWTPLLLAARNGHTALVTLLLEEGSNIESKDRSGLTPLIWAARNGHVAVVGLVLERSCKLESKDNNSQTPLVLKRSCKLEPKDRNGQTPLMWAAENGHKAVVKLLLKRGAELESKDRYGRTPLAWAARNGHKAVVKLLLKKGARLESRNNEIGWTPLFWAAMNGHEAVVKLLLEKGAELECKDKHGQTPLSWAAGNGHEVLVKLLLENGAKLESKDKYGRTPLWQATEKKHEAIVKLLLKKGADNS